MQNEIVEIMLTEEQIQNRIKEMAAEINKEYAGKNPIFVGVLRGVVVFFSDFIRQFNDYCQIDFMCISSYRGANSTGECIMTKDTSLELRNRHVIILEDIFDTGKSLDFTYHVLQAKHPASLKVVTQEKANARTTRYMIKGRDLRCFNGDVLLTWSCWDQSPQRRAGYGNARCSPDHNQRRTCREW